GLLERGYGDRRVDVVEQPRAIERLRQGLRRIDPLPKVRAEEHGVRVRQLPTELSAHRLPIHEKTDVGIVALRRVQVAVPATVPGRIPHVEEDPMSTATQRPAKPAVRRRVPVPPRTRYRQPKEDQLHDGGSVRVDR